MKRTLSYLLLAVLSSATLVSTANARTDVGVSVSVNQPGVYGRIDIGNQPPPAVIYAEPVIIAPRPAYQVRPIYMHVPPGHHKNWRRYCAGVGLAAPVHGHGHGHGRGHGHGHH